MAPPVEEVKLPQPQSDDAVLGGQNPTLASSVVLGGLEGVKRRLVSTEVESKIVALKEALKYGQAGVDLVIQALNNESKSIAQAVYWQLRASSEPLAQQALQEYNPYQFLQCIFSGHLGWNGTNPVTISPDSQTLICGSIREGFILWNLYTGKRQPTLRIGSDSISCIAVSPDGLTLITGDWNGIIALWKLPTGEQKSTLYRSSGTIKSVAISPDGHTFVSGSDDGTHQVWNLSTCEELHTVKGYSIEVNFVAISPDNFTLVSHGTDRWVVDN
jgi:WD40 repeat protein